jgi:D-glycero-D-manno-heptose 1,7-bisphosphate phosphatase
MFHVNVYVDEENGHHVARWANGMVYGKGLLWVVRIAMAYPLDAEGVWCDLSSCCNRGGPALFLDRDGVVVEEVDYLHRIEDIALCAAAAAVISAANAKAIPVVLVTNQAGIGRGYYGWAEFHAVQEAILSVIAQEGAHIDAVYACPHHRDGQGAFAHPDHPARKPNPGMLQRAAAALDIDMARSWLVGDRAGDVEAAKRAGLAGALHVLTGYGQAERAAALALSGPRFDVRAAASIAEALTLPLFDRAQR